MGTAASRTFVGKAQREGESNGEATEHTGRQKLESSLYFTIKVS